MKQVTKTIGTNLLTISQFATKKKVARNTVYTHINAGKLDIVEVGMHKETFIDWKKHSKYEFQESMKRF